MLDSIVTLDTALFRFVNHDLANPVFDVVMPIITNVTYLFLPYLVLLVMLCWKGGARGRWCVALILLGVALSDPINSRIVKELVERIRPCATLTDVRLLVPCGAGKSFPSTHAVNNFVAAVIIGYFYPRWLALALGVAGAIGFSRIYVGVHYPFDVIGGAALGAVIAGAVLLLWILARRLKDAQSKSKGEEVAGPG
jgi:undecaprenyl-diphosphatase